MYTVIPTARFEKDIKYYIKKKRYFHIGEDIRQITNELQRIKQNTAWRKQQKSVWRLPAPMP